MAEPLPDRIIQAINQAANQYHRLVILLGPNGAGKTNALQEVNKRTKMPLLNVNLSLSRQMLELTERQRALQLPRLMSELINTANRDVVLLDNIEVLFDVSLKQDPLRLLQGLSRNNTIVVAWNGVTENEHLVYAIPGHVEYKRYPLENLLLVNSSADN
jgi:ABC-type hemin transport system ATPase subunit